jgi:hypothetical protein
VTAAVTKEDAFFVLLDLGALDLQIFFFFEIFRKSRFPHPHATPPKRILARYAQTARYIRKQTATYCCTHIVE